MSGRHVVRNVFDLLGGFQTLLLVVAPLLAVLVFGIGNGQFLSSADQSILLSSAWFGILAVGTTFALAAGAADFSIMATTALSGIVAAGVSGSLSPVIGVPAAIGAAMAIGLVNGLIVVRFRVNGFLATLVMAGAVRGVDYLLGSGTRGIAVTDDFMGDVLAPRSARSRSPSGSSSSLRSAAPSSCAGRGSGGHSSPSAAVRPRLAWLDWIHPGRS